MHNDIDHHLMEDVDLSGESGGPFPSQRWPRPQPLQQGESPSAGSLSPSAWTSISVDTPNLSSFRKRLFGDNDGGGDGGTSVVDEDDLLTDLCPQPPVAGIMAPLSELNASAGFGGRSSVPGQRQPASPRPSPWLDPLHLSIFASNLLAAAAESVPIALVPTIGGVLGTEDGAASAFASRAAASAVLGTSLGKFVNGPAGDVFGARRVAGLYAALMGASLLLLSCCLGEASAVAACVLVEFFSTVQQPCTLVVLAAHCRDGGEGGGGEEGGGDGGDGGDGGSVNTSSIWEDVALHGGSEYRAEPRARGRYEAGVYVASLGSRFGSLIAIPLSASLLHRGWGWRAVARAGALLSLANCAVFHRLVSDSPGRVHDPQNPVRPSTIAAARSRHGRALATAPFWVPLRRAPGGSSRWVRRIHLYCCIAWGVFLANIVPSLRSVLRSGTFWVVAVAHAGGSMIRSSERILGTYLRDTSGGTMSENRAGGLTIFLSLGMFFGLAIGGNLFTKMAHQPKKRKQMVLRLYVLVVAMCYTLSFLAVPFVRALMLHPYIVTMLQVTASFIMGAGVAVQFYQIPAIVGATYGANKGLYSAYTDGVAYGVSSVIWRVVGGAVEEGHPEQGGWAYGWAAVALLVVLCAFLMVEFVERYFCRDGWKGRMEKAASDAALTKLRERKNEEQVSGGVVERSSNFLRRRLASPLGLTPNGNLQSSMSRLSGVGIPPVPQISPMKYLKNIRPLRSGKSALDDVIEGGDEDDDHEGDQDEEGNILENESDEESTGIFESIAGPVTFDDVETFGSSHKNVESEPKTREEEMKHRLLELLDVEGNHRCCDCDNHFPRWASIVVGESLESHVGCFVCHECVGFHRKLGTHVVFVRSVDHDNFREQEIRSLEEGGNAKVNSWLQAGLSDRGGLSRELFIRRKYEEKAWARARSDSISMAVGDLLGLSVVEKYPGTNEPDEGENIELVTSLDTSGANTTYSKGGLINLGVAPTASSGIGSYHYSSEEMMSL